MDNRPKTLFIDIDGLLLRHYGSGNKQARVENPEVLPGVLRKLDEWDRKGYRFILVTGRRESTRVATEKQLHSKGIVYDQLIMGIGGEMSSYSRSAPNVSRVSYPIPMSASKLVLNTHRSESSRLKKSISKPSASAENSFPFSDSYEISRPTSVRKKELPIASESSS